MIVIGLRGENGAGKTTIANYLVKQYGFVEIMIAEPIKEYLVKCKSVPADIVYASNPKSRAMRDEEKDDKGRTVRQRLIDVATRWKNIDDDIWACIAEKKARELIAAGKARIVISDCRFESDFKIIGNLGGQLLKVSRNEKDAYFLNNGTMKELAAKIDAFMAEKIKLIV